MCKKGHRISNLQVEVENSLAIPKTVFHIWTNTSKYFKHADNNYSWIVLPLDFLTSGVKAFVTRTVPHRLTSAIRLNISTVHHSAWPKQEIPALLATAHKPAVKKNMKTCVNFMLNCSRYSHKKNIKRRKERKFSVKISICNWSPSDVTYMLGVGHFFAPIRLGGTCTPPYLRNWYHPPKKKPSTRNSKRHDLNHFWRIKSENIIHHLKLHIGFVHKVQHYNQPAEFN